MWKRERKKGEEGRDIKYESKIDGGNLPLTQLIRP